MKYTIDYYSVKMTDEHCLMIINNKGGSKEIEMSEVFDEIKKEIIKKGPGDSFEKTKQSVTDITHNRFRNIFDLRSSSTHIFNLDNNSDIKVSDFSIDKITSYYLLFGPSLFQFLGSINEPEQIYFFFDGKKISEKKYNVNIVISKNIDNVLRIINHKYIEYAVHFYQILRKRKLKF